jgi:Flp pilus assembly pilin Flp
MSLACYFRSSPVNGGLLVMALRIGQTRDEAAPWSGASIAVTCAMQPGFHFYQFGRCMIKRIKSSPMSWDALAESQGQDLVEYALLMVMIALGASASINSVAIKINTMFINLAGKFPF